MSAVQTEMFVPASLLQSRPHMPPPPITRLGPEHTLRALFNTTHTHGQVMKDFTSKKLDALAVIKKICVIFAPYPGLILGINSVLPAGFLVQANEGGAPGQYLVTITETREGRATSRQEIVGSQLMGAAEKATLCKLTKSFCFCFVVFVC
jgi:hypothetical protein